MKKIGIHTTVKQLLADVFTPVGIYLRLRDRFRDTVLLESTDSHSSEHSWSFICINAIGGIEIRTPGRLEFKLPARNPETIVFAENQKVDELISAFMQRFEIEKGDSKEHGFAQGLYGYMSYDAIRFFEKKVPANDVSTSIPLIRYRLYQYVIAINHFKDDLFICENHINGINSETAVLESLIKSKDVPQYPFAVTGTETSNLSDDEFIEMASKGIAHCHRGDVFQVVFSRQYKQPFRGDEFNVYRALRSINPSPYLFFFDYGDYKLIGSSPESQLLVKGGTAIIHPIAGTYRRTGDDEADQFAAEKLLADPKENAEHVMLVDLARNDLSRTCSDVVVSRFRQLQFFSHVIHLVSEVKGTIQPGIRPFALLVSTFPAGTLSGAPKVKAMELISKYEKTPRGYYGGTIGMIGFDGSCNHAIMIRTFLSRNNTLVYQAGAGIVAASDPVTELFEVKNKLAALRKAVELAQTI